MVRLYMDENVRGAITRGLRRRGVDVVTAWEDGRAATPDPDVLDGLRDVIPFPGSAEF